MSAEPPPPPDPANPKPLTETRNQAGLSPSPNSNSAANAAQIAPPTSIDPNATIPPTPVGPATAALAQTAPTSKRDIPLPDIVLGGPEPFNAARSPLIRIIKLCTLLLKLFVGLTIMTLMLFYYLSISNPTIAAKMNSKAGLTPFKTVNEILAMPAKVMGKTKDVVASNNERVADLDNVIQVSDGNEKKRSRAQNIAVTPPAPVAEAVPVAPPTAGANAPASAIGQIFALPGQVIGQTKAVVEKNNSRTGVLDGVIANPQGTAAQTNKFGGQAVGTVDPTKPVKPPPPVNTSVSADEKEELAQSLIDFSLAQSTEDPAAGTGTLQKPAVPTPAGPVAPVVATLAQPRRIQLGGGIAVTSPAIADTVEAGESFITWTMNVKISGIFPGNPARIMLNDRLARAGDPAHVRLGITFVGLDTENRLILFRDKAGASVARSY
jgi:hypothetical protein